MLVWEDIILFLRQLRPAIYQFCKAALLRSRNRPAPRQRRTEVPPRRGRPLLSPQTSLLTPFHRIRPQSFRCLPKITNTRPAVPPLPLSPFPYPPTKTAPPV